MAIFSPSDTLNEVGPRNRTQFWRVERYAGLECLEARFHDHVFPLHSHETYVLGTVVAGVNSYHQSGRKVHAGPGEMCFINPGELHDGNPPEQGYYYRMIYPEVAVLKDIILKETGRSIGTPQFSQAVVKDPQLCQLFMQLHQGLEEQGPSLITDEQLLSFFVLLLKRYGEGLLHLSAVGQEPAMVALVKDYLMSHMDEKVELATLAQLSGLSPFHLIRAFAKATGFTPFNWLMDKRIHLARMLLRRGEPIVAVAQSCGFYDQSHFSRSFKARLGVTPAQFRRLGPISK